MASTAEMTQVQPNDSEQPPPSQQQQQRNIDGEDQNDIDTPFEFDFDNIIELSQAAKTFLLKVFATNFVYILLFPMSEICRFAYYRKLQSQMLAFGVAVIATVFWVYFWLFISTRDHTSRIYEAELKIPFVLLVVLSIDTALSLSFAALKGKMKVIEDFKVAFKKAQQETESSGKRHYSSYLRALSQVITVMPSEPEVRQARKLLSDIDVVIPLAKETTDDVLNKFTLVCYDLAFEKALGPSGGVHHANSPSGMEEAEKFFSSGEDFDKAGIPRFNLGKSYARQAHEDREIRVEALADQLIWGVREEVMGCNGVCERFWRLDKIPSVTVAVGFVAISALLPTMFRAYDKTLKDLNGYEHLISALFVIMTIGLSLQVGVFFVTIIDVFKTEYQRMSLLTTLMSPNDSAEMGLPVFDFSQRSHIMAWLGLRQYLSTFSRTTVLFFGQRLVVYTFGLVGSIAYLGTLYVNNSLSSEAVFTSWVIVYFLGALVYFLMILAFGSMTNNQMTEHRAVIASKIMVLHERKFRLHRAGDDAVVEDDNIRFLYDLSNFLSHQPLVTLLGLELTPAVAGSLGAVLVSLGGSVLPILTNAFGARLGD